MKGKSIFSIVIIVFIALLFSAILPFGSMAKANDLTIEEITNINNAFEEEPYPEEITDPYLVAEKLNWFSTVNAMFEKFTETRVIDCLTQKEYSVERVGGYNHADVETLSTYDTGILKSLYGGSWSWERRPVWVEINGVFVAGSINGYPHSYEYNTENGENGHTCIHFYMSRTHGTDNLDPAHQNAVEYAYTHSDDLNTYIYGR